MNDTVAGEYLDEGISGAKGFFDRSCSLNLFADRRATPPLQSAAESR